MKKSNPLKTFNDAFDKKKAGLKKAQDGAQTAFQSYMKQYPTASPSDTLAGSAPVFDGGIQTRALETAKKKTYGDNFAPSTNPKAYTTAKGYFDKEGYGEARAAEKTARIPQQKKGGQTKSKK